MSSIEEPRDGVSGDQEAEPGSAEDQAYFRRLEEHLLQLRGSTTLLSPADWQVASEWRRRCIPIELVTGVMNELVARQRARSSKRGVSSLRYFRAAVGAAWEEQLELGAGGVAPRFDPGPPLESRLRALAAAIPEALSCARELRDELAALQGDMEEIETALVELDRRLIEAVDAALPAEARSRIDARVVSATRSFVATLPADELALLAARLRAQALREEAGVPVLSLFSAAALESERPESERPESEEPQSAQPERDG